MQKMLLKVELDENEILGKLARIENISYKLYSELRDLQSAIIARDETCSGGVESATDSDSEPAAKNN